MKVLRKEVVGKMGQGRIQSEEEILQKLDNPFLVKMHYSFESVIYLLP